MSKIGDGFGKKAANGCGSILSLMIASVIAQLFAEIPASVYVLLVVGGAFVWLAANYTGWKGALACLAALGIIFLGIAPSTWLSLSIMLAIALHGFQQRFAEPAPPVFATISLSQPEPPAAPEISPRRKLVSSIFKGLKETTLGVSAALAILVGVNAVLQHLDPSELDLHPLEAGLLYCQIAIGELTSWHVLAFGLLAATLIAAVSPALNPVTRLLAAMKWVKRTALPLAILSSFTLFTSAAFPAYQGVWAVARREELVRDVEAVKLWRKSAIAAARAQVRFEQMPPPEVSQFSSHYHAETAHASEREMESYGEQIGERSSDLGDSMLQPKLPASAEEASGEAAVKQTMEWLENPSLDPPTRKQAAQCKAEAGRAEAVYKQAREALISVIQARLKLPVDDPFVKPFVGSLVGTSVKTSMESMIPENLRDYAAVREWWRGYRANRSSNPDASWDWTVEPKPESERPPASEAEAKLASSPETLLAERVSLGLLRFTERYSEVVSEEPPSVWSARPGPAMEEEEPFWRRSPNRGEEGPRRSTPYEPEPSFRPPPEPPPRPIIIE